MKTNSHWKSNGYNRRGAGRIIDADGHVRETEEQIMEYMPAGYRSRREAMLYFPLVPHHGWHRSIPANDFSYQDFRVPDWREWASKLDEGNIELTVLYPTRFMHIGQIGNPRYAVGLCRAYNDFLAEQFLTQDRRFRGMALLPLQDVSAAVKELRRAVKNHGMVGGILPAEGLPLPLGHALYRPIFIEADRLGCALSVHSCTSLRDNDRFLQPNEVATLAHVIPQMRQFTNIVFSGLMNKLKKLRLGFLEAGLRLGAIPDQQDRGAIGPGFTKRAACAAKRAACPQAVFLSMRRGEYNRARYRATRPRLSALGL